MTKKEAAILSAYTGLLFGSFSDLHGYAEKILKRPIFTHQFAMGNMAEELKIASRADFLNVMENIEQ